MAELEPYLSLVEAGGVWLAVCSQHGSCYTQHSLDSYLALSHKVRRKRRVELLLELCESGLATGREDVPLPLDGSAPLHGLPILHRYKCRKPGCRFISASSKNISRHCYTKHRQSQGPKGRKKKQQQPQLSSTPLPFEPVSIQTLWAQKQHINYFIVQEAMQDPVASHPNLWTEIEARYQHAQDQQAKQQTTMLEAIEHVSELTPWLKSTGYASHLEGLLLDQIAQAYQLPDKGDKPELAAICVSVSRLLQKGMAVLDNDEEQEERRLSKVNAKLLNTFRGAEISQDPIKPLQNSQSRQKYIQT